MAGGAVASAALKLGDLLMEEASFLGGVRGEVEWLRTQLRWMECFLKDADARRRKGDERMNNWVRDVREVAYQAEDAVDTFIYHIQGRRRRTHNNLHFLRRYACMPVELLHLHHLGNEIWQIKSKIQSIHDSRVAYGIANLGEAGEELSSTTATGRNDEEDDDDVRDRLLAWRQVSPHLGDDTIVVGFDTYTQLILVTFLLDVSTPRRLVVSIVGMGGLGKTTLATTLYNSREVEAHFSTCAWITVSQSYRVSGLLRNIINKVVGTVGGGGQFDRMDEGELKSSLYEFLRHTRYFIVLDDIWAQVMWEQIKPAFPNANNGSRVLLTTRFVNIAKSADPTVSPFELPFLTEQQSWELFLNKVFPYTTATAPSKCPKELEELGRDLVKRCGGLPLALVVLGGMLSRKEPTFSSWLQVADNMDWESTGDGQQCLQILALSYTHLPNHYLKSCFLYLGCFPEDYLIKASELITLWIAEGFIPLNERQTPEETAHGYIDELVQRCMVHVVERSATTKWVKSVRIHDLVRDLCISEAKEDRFFQYCSNYIARADHEIAASRRLVMLDKVYQSDEFCHSGTIYSVRAVLGFNSRSLDMMILNSILQGFKLLRVIHLYCPPEVEFHKSMLPKEISSLIHLRHITLRTLRLWYLPSSIGKLRNLLTLNIRETNILTLPKTIYKIGSLRHVYTMGAFSVGSASIGHLRSLHTLKIALSGSWIQRDLPKLSSLRKLAIAQVSVMELPALSYSFARLNRLTSLNLQTFGSIPAASLFTSLPSHQHLHKLTLDGSWTAIHQLPQNLITLSLIHCNLDQDAIAAVERLTRLVFLNLDTCQLAEEKMVCSTGWFPQLQNLQVNRLNRLKHWRIECGAMPKLTYLKIKDCHELIMLPDGLEHVASLQKLEMTGFHPGIMTRLNSTGEDRHKIQRIPSYHIVPEDQ